MLEVSSNLHAEEDWHSIPFEAGGKRRYRSVRRLTVDNLDMLAAPLARCSIERPMLADLSVDATGRVVAVASDGTSAPCVAAQAERGAFDCTANGQPATIRLAIYPPVDEEGADAVEHR